MEALSPSSLLIHLPIESESLRSELGGGGVTWPISAKGVLVFNFCDFLSRLSCSSMCLFNTISRGEYYSSDFLKNSILLRLIIIKLYLLSTFDYRMIPPPKMGTSYSYLSKKDMSWSVWRIRALGALEEEKLY